MKTKRALDEDAAVAAEVARLERDVIRRGLRHIIKKDGSKWAPLWVRSDGNAWRIERQYGGEPLLTIRLDELQGDARATMDMLLTLLDEQAWMARIAQCVAGEPVERDAKIVVRSNDGGRATADAANKKYAGLDDRILGFLRRGESTREHTKEWAHQLKVSRSTIERRIKLAKDKFTRR